MPERPTFGRPKPPTERSHLEARLAAYIEAQGLPRPVRQFRFHPTRKWTLDFAYPALGVALEVEGAIFVGGRHSRGASFARDAEKYNAAASLGWFVYRVTTQQFRDGSVFALVAALGERRPTYHSPVLVASSTAGGME